MSHADDVSDRRALTGRRVLVTRPAGQAEALCRSLADAGAVALRFPTLEILPATDYRAADRIAARLAEYRIAIYISANAVRWALRRYGRPPAGLRLAVVGRASRLALREFGLDANLMPEQGFDSDALLALPALRRVAGQKLVIFRGEGGRERLAEVLRARGARVDYAEIYRRGRPRLDPEPLLRLWRADAAAIFAATATSNEALQNLYDAVGAAGREPLRATPLALVSERAATRAKELGWRAPIAIAADAGEQALLDALRSLLH